MGIKGWQITGWVAAALALLIGISFASAGFSEAAIRSIVRGTAKLSVLLFLSAFAASSLRAFWPNDVTTWLLQNRRYIGVSFALSHFTHLAALVGLAVAFPHPFVDDLRPITLVGGGLAYAFITAMTITSFSAPRRAIGAKAWTVLHTVGGYYIWTIFLNSYLSRAMRDLEYAPFAIALLAVLTLRIVHAIKRRTPITPEMAKETP